MKIKNAFLSAILVIACVPTVMAASVEIKWTDPEKYTDISPGEDNRKSFQDNVFYNLEKHFKKLAEKLPEDQVLNIDVTNIDLAGTTHHAGISQIRLVKESYPPRMTFSYQLVNADKSIDTEGEAKLKDFSFMMNQNLRYRDDFLGYEKQMLDEWFGKTFADKVVDKKD